MINKFISGLSATEKKVLLVAALFVLGALFDRLLIGPSLSHLRELDESIAREEATIQSNIEFLSYRDKIIKEATVFKEFFSQGTTTEEEVIAGFLKKVETIASGVNIETSKITPAGQDYQQDYLKYYISLDCSGTLEDIIKFVYTINNSRELLKVEQLSLAGNARAGEKIKANLSISKMIVSADPSVDAKTLVEPRKDGAQDPSQVSAGK